MRHALMALLAAVAGSLATPATAADAPALPPTVVWTAYDIGSGTFNQAVAIGGVLKQNYGSNLRILPGKNAVSRLTPLMQGRAQFAATGSDSIYAQEGVYAFGTRDWGPRPIRLLMQNVNDGCAVSMAVAGDAGVKKMSDLKGKRVAWVRGSPGLNRAVEAMLAFGGLDWNDVERVEVGGFGASIDGIINDQIDAAEIASNSGFMVKLDATSRGVVHPPMPHDDDAGWDRLQKVVPWYFRHVCKAGPVVQHSGPFEGASTASPLLISTPEVEPDFAEAMTAAMHESFDLYKDAAPGADGWAPDRQLLDQVVMPVHEGAIRYYARVGRWTAEAQARHDANLARQAVLAEAWEHIEKSGTDADFAARWQLARAAALRSRDMEVIFDAW